jgi:hypothetical protein
MVWATEIRGRRHTQARNATIAREPFILVTCSPGTPDRSAQAGDVDGGSRDRISLARDLFTLYAASDRPTAVKAALIDPLAARRCERWLREALTAP